MSAQPASVVPPAVVIEPQVRARSTVILLHGLGADGHDLAQIVPAIGLDPALGVRWVLPHAPRRPLAIAAGELRSAWFDVGPEDLWRSVTSDPSGLAAADASVRALIEREVERGVPTNRIVLGGFSQGGALASYVAVRFEKPLAGAVALSTYLARNVSVEAESVSANRGLPVFAAHGTLDTVVAPTRGRELRDRLAALGCAVTYREYPMGHEVCAEELVDLGRFLDGILGR